MNNKKKNGCIIPIIIFLGLFVAFFINMVNTTNSYFETAKKFETASEEENTNAIGILKECGIENVKVVIRDELLDHDSLVGYRLSTELDNIGKVIVYFDNEKLRQVKFSANYLYRNQQIEAVAQDFYVSTDEATRYQLNCQEAIKELLKAPSTAKFPNMTEWGFKKEDGVVTVQSYVDAQNGFGAMLRSYFQFKIKDNTVTSLIFDEVEYIK